MGLNTKLESFEFEGSIIKYSVERKNEFSFGWRDIIIHGYEGEPVEDYSEREVRKSIAILELKKLQLG